MKIIHISIVSAVFLGAITGTTLFMRGTHTTKQPSSLSLNTPEQSLSNVKTSPKPSFEKSEDSNPELAKLKKRKERWQNADKCLRALITTNGRVEELCASVRDVHLLAKEAGVIYTFPIVETHLQSLDAYEKQLKEGIISSLPQDEPMTLSAYSSLTDVELENSNYQIDMRTTKSKTCLLQAQIGEVNYEECKAQVDDAYETYKRDSELRHNNIKNALDKFEQDYKKDL